LGEVEEAGERIGGGVLVAFRSRGKRIKGTKGDGDISTKIKDCGGYNK
jgi:hypothetical protein